MLRLGVVFALLLPAAFANQPYHAGIRFENVPADEELATFAVDNSGNVFMVGYLTNGFGGQRVRADKFDSNGNSLGNFEVANVSGFVPGTVAGAAVDPNGNLVIVGSTSSLTSELLTIGGAAPVFVIKIDSQLKTLLSSTTLGGSGSQLAVVTIPGGITLDKTGNIYVTGQTSDPAFPVTAGAFQMQLPQNPGGSFPLYAFVTKIAADGKTLAFSSYFGASTVPCDPASDECPASAETNGSAITLDPGGNVIVAGYTNTSQLPLPAGAFSSNCGDCGKTRPDSYRTRGSWRSSALTGRSCWLELTCL